MWRRRRRRRGWQAEHWAAGMVAKQLAIDATRFRAAHEHECMVVQRVWGRPNPANAPEALVAPSVLHVAISVEALDAVYGG